MICKNCGHENTHVLYRAVFPPVPVTFVEAAPPSRAPAVYKRWACGKCGRYHFADGSLYKNPFRAHEEDAG